MNAPELSIIIPTLNEEAVLPLLLNDLVVQQAQLPFEVIVSDGGSSDNTREVTATFFADGRLSGKVLSGPSGRGLQLNAGADIARAEWLLFLHADSRFTEASQLKDALDLLQQENQKKPERTTAGRFSLRFDFKNRASFSCFFFESKAALGLPGSIHGDQGMLLAKSFFQEVGPFREDLPVMEDTCFAEEVRLRGEWFLLPTSLITSARRFEVEGMAARQTLNALMMNFLSVGWLVFFEKAPEIYRQQASADKLQLGPFYQLISKLLKSMPLRQRASLWLATGRYVRSQAWQIALWLDCKKAYRDMKPIRSQGPWLGRCLRVFDPLTDNWLGHAITALLVRVWFATRSYSS